MRYFEIISEGRDALIYHTMDFDKAENVFKHDLMEAKWKHNIPGYGEVIGNSFTRNPKLQWRSGSITISINQAALSRRNKIIPLDGQFVHASTTDMKFPHRYLDRTMQFSNIFINLNDYKSLSEEFIVGDIKNLHRYIVEIKLNDPQQNYYILNQYNMCTQYSKKWNIPLVATPKFLEYLEKARIQEPNITTFWDGDF